MAAPDIFKYLRIQRLRIDADAVNTVRLQDTHFLITDHIGAARLEIKLRCVVAELAADVRKQAVYLTLRKYCRCSAADIY